ncbi:MAG TPA: adenylate kinase [Gemmatimonadaceae bacterium]|jgi:adenylate kinase|nr:adenylate kinase [Gemmatimonadaceae bacterium]
MNIVLFGKPGAGKGTQAPRLAQALGVPILATGDVLRGAAQAGTRLGLEAKAYMDRGALVPDDVILGLVRETLADPRYADGVILDGVVRTVPQAEGMRDVMTSLGRQVDAVLHFDVTNDEIVRRLGSRLVCDRCQTPYMTGAVGDRCPKCGGTLVRRKDDEPDAIRHRLEVFERQTAPVFAWYATHDTHVVTVDATGPVEAVTARALRALGRPA